MSREVLDYIGVRNLSESRLWYDTNTKTNFSSEKIDRLGEMLMLTFSVSSENVSDIFLETVN